MKRWFIFGGLVAALAVGAVAVAGAQEGGSPTPVPDAQSEDTDTGDTARGERREDFLNRLAENLGVSREDLDGAVDETQIEMIDQALADGRIDEEKAAELKERVANGEPLFPFFGGGGHGHIRHIVVSFIEVAADVLGLEVDDVKEQAKDGSSLADIATAQGVDVETFKTDLLAGIKTKLDAQVASGDLEQDRADEMYARFSENIDDIVNKTHDGEHRPFPRLPRFEGALPFEGGVFEGEAFEGIPDFGVFEEEITVEAGA